MIKNREKEHSIYKGTPLPGFLYRTDIQRIKNARQLCYRSLKRLTCIIELIFNHLKGPTTSTLKTQTIDLNIDLQTHSVSRIIRIEIQIEIQINTIYTMTKNSFYNYLQLTGHQVDLQYYFEIMKDAAPTGTCEYYCDYYINQLFPDEPVQY